MSRFIFNSRSYLLSIRFKAGYFTVVIKPLFAFKYRFKLLHGWFYNYSIQLLWLEFKFCSLPPS